MWMNVSHLCAYMADSVSTHLAHIHVSTVTLDGQGITVTQVTFILLILYHITKLS